MTNYHHLEIMLRQKLSHKLLQKLSPQQIQLMKLLQIPTATLDQRIQEELEANPALDEGEDNETNELVNGGGEGDKEVDDTKEQQDDDFELDDYLNEYIEDDPISYRMQNNSNNQEEFDKNIPIAVESTFHDHLERQLGMVALEDERLIKIGQQIIGSIDEDGYLRRDPISIIDDLLFSQNIEATEAEILKVLTKIQTFDPPGIGARNLKECLIIQLDQKIEAEDEKLSKDDPKILGKKILEKYFNEFSKKHFSKLQKTMDITELQLKEIMEEILKLNPKPASGVAGGGSQSIQYIVPDFIISNREGELELTLNSRNAPELRINDQYVDMLKSYNTKRKVKKNSREEKKAIIFIKQKIDSAKWFIDAIKQRQATLYKTMYAILQFQYEFFKTGDQLTLKPMILKDISEITGLDISTVSRVANSKFVQTEFGTKRLKSFFSESLQNKAGEEVSTIEVKNILSGIIVNEDKRKPLSDEKLKDMLQEKGYNIARRTVAKYREQLNMPVARLRKEL